MKKKPAQCTFRILYKTVRMSEMLKTSVLYLMLMPLILLSQTLNAETQNQSYVSVLQYHHISKTTPASTSTSPDVFAQHMDLLASEGFEVWSLPKLLASLKAKIELPAKVVALTFDDGYLSVYDNAYPLLKRRGWPFTIFVASDDIEHNYGPVMSWQQLQEMQKNGGTIANHSKDHAYLIDVPGDAKTQLSTINKDLYHTELRIQQMLGKTPKLLAYPYGEYNLGIKAVTASLGLMAFGQQSGPLGENSDWQALPRYPLSGIYANPKRLKEKLYTLPLPVVDVRPENIISFDRQPKLSFALQEMTFKPHQLNCYASGQGAVPIEYIKGRFEVKVNQSFRGRRGRINCTAPIQNQKGYYWYSKVWIFRNKT